MMRSETLRDRLLQLIGLIVLAGLTAAFIFAFRAHKFPRQDEGDKIDIIFEMSTDDGPEEEAVPDPVEGLEDLLSGASGESGESGDPDAVSEPDASVEAE